MKYKAIIFDFFGVIVSDMYIDWVNKNNLSHLILELRENYFKKSDLGEISVLELHKYLADLVNRPASQVEAELKERLIINMEVVSFIKSTKAKIKIALCSNAPTSFVENFLKESNLEVLFDEIVISSQMGVRKPDVGIFNETLELLEIKTEDAIFIDDTVRNIEAASLLGIKSILFTNYKNLEKDLLECGIQCYN